MTPSEGPTEWEYTRSSALLEGAWLLQLQALGLEGWELVSEHYGPFAGYLLATGEDLWSRTNDPRTWAYHGTFKRPKR